MPIYRCREKGCNFSTDDLGVFIDHVVKEKLGTPPPKPKVFHKTVKEFVECPQCYEKIEKELLARGYTKPEEKREERKKGFPV